MIASRSPPSPIIASVGRVTMPPAAKPGTRRPSESNEPNELIFDMSPDSSP
jgi:hypothetical protein